MLARLSTELEGGLCPVSSESSEGGSLLLSSEATPWKGLPFDLRRLQGAEDFVTHAPPAGECGLFAFTEGNMELTFGAGKEARDVARKGAVSFVASEERHTVSQAAGSAVAAVVRLPQAWFERALLEGPPEGFGRGAPLEQDDTVEALIQSMCREVSAGAPTGRLFAEALSLALVTYAVERVPPSKLRVRGGLSDEQCRRIRGYIRDRLQQDLSLVELSSLVGLRPRQFSTLFRRAFGTTAHRYIIAQRVAEAARMLGSGDDNLAGIALRIGFCSQSHFTAAFRQAYGVTPGRYAAERRKSVALA